MQPIQRLLNRIRWDPEFGKGHFTIGYLDRVEYRIILIPFKTLHFDAPEHFKFEVIDAFGNASAIPFHRVKKVYKDGTLIWKRTH